MKTIKLPSAITIAIAVYYINRDKQYKVETQYIPADGDTRSSLIYVAKAGKKWDKEADLDMLVKACKAHKFHLQASSGTFWLRRANQIQSHYRIDETTWPLAEVLANKPSKKS